MELPETELIRQRYLRYLKHRSVGHVLSWQVSSLCQQCESKSIIKERRCIQIYHRLQAAINKLYPIRFHILCPPLFPLQTVRYENCTILQGPKSKIQNQNPALKNASQCGFAQSSDIRPNANFRGFKSFKEISQSNAQNSHLSMNHWRNALWSSRSRLVQGS